MIRLIAIFFVFAFFLAFIILNLEHKCDVSLGFISFKEIPVFLSAIFSFVLGMFFSVPLVFSLLGKKRKKLSKTESSADKIKDDLSSLPEPIKKTDSPYGID